MTGPAFASGLLYGINKRFAPEYKQDNYAHYKLLSLTSILGLVRIVGTNHTPLAKTHTAELFRHGVLGGVFMSGTMFCMGIMMTKIPGPIFTEDSKKQEGVKIKLF